eukprot:TRINITY_DN8471_c0_g1_i1.p1 TRINITY_DN8471_c0_g1~~TRINITY_DN8471_c0_g1_i1.p1  ORF type:complete len:1067 (+),score=210.63 TRINITY_DN8471_c0_g1_i1:320-3202(+)
MRSELGAVKLEQRFSQTLRSTNSGEGSSSQTQTPGFTATGTPKEVLRHEAQEVVGEELAKRLSIYDKRLTDLQKEQLTETSSMRGRLEAALRESDQHMSRADELQALLKEEQGRRALLLARLEAVEASCTDLRTGQQDLSSAPETIEKLLRHEMQREVDKLRNELHSSRSASEQYGQTVSRATESTDYLNRRCDEMDERVRDLQQQQIAEIAALRGRIEAAVRECDRQVAASDGLHVQMREEQRRSDTIETRLDKIETKRTDEDYGSLRAELHQEMSAVRDELERGRSEQTANLQQLEANSLELNRRVEEGARKVTELKQDHMSETVALRGRMEELVGENHVQQVDIGDLKSRMNEVESGKVGVLDARLKAVESRSSMLEDTVSVPTNTAAHSTEDIGEIRTSLLSSHQSIGQLAKELSSIREEHDQAISSLGSLTELVAKSATAGIQRFEERISADLTGKRQELERAITHHKEQMDRDAKALILEVKNLIPQMTSLAGGPLGRSPPSEDGSEYRDVTAALRRIDVVARELRSEAAAQAEASEARVASAEAAFGSDLKRLRGMLSTCVSQLESMQVELSQLELTRIGPRLSSVEAKLDGKAIDDSLDGSTEAGRSRTSATETSKQSEVAVTLGLLRERSAERTRDPEPVQMGLKQKLHGIANSVHQVLGALEGIGATESDMADNVTVASGFSTGSAMSGQHHSSRPSGVTSATSTENLQASSRTSSIGLGGRQSAGVLDHGASRRAGSNRDSLSNTGQRGLSLDPSWVAEEGSASRTGGLVSPKQSVQGSGLSSLVGAATGASSKNPPQASMRPGGRGAFTAPGSHGPSRERSPTSTEIRPSVLNDKTLAEARQDLSRTAPSGSRSPPPSAAGDRLGASRSQVPQVGRNAAQGLMPGQRPGQYQMPSQSPNAAMTMQQGRQMPQGNLASSATPALQYGLGRGALPGQRAPQQAFSRRGAL